MRFPLRFCVQVFRRLVPLAAGLGCFPALGAAPSWGDQGDGTYRNPVLNGDFADADVERRGDTWYLITSTNHLAPGMTILESKDLVNWRYTGHVWPTLSWKPAYDWPEMNGYSWGVWAGDLAQRDGEWLCYMIDKTAGLYVSKARDIHGPWSAPTCVLAVENWTDPAVYFGERTKEAWLVCHAGKDATTGRNDLRLFKLSWDGTRLLDEGRAIFQGDGVEAPKIHRIGERWYVMAIEWRGKGKTRDRQQLCFRSTTDSIAGPYEAKTVLMRATDEDRSACQGSLVQVPSTGEWWYLHQLVQNGTPVFQGRPQCLEPVTWQDGWPVIGEVTEPGGVGQPVASHRKPLNGPADFSLATSDEFSAPVLGAQWNWNHNPRAERWSLAARPGWLRLGASHPVRTPAPAQEFWRAPNTLSQRHLGVAAGRVETRLDLAGLRPGAFTGLCHFSADYALCGVRVSADGRRQLVVRLNGVEALASAPAGQALLLRSDWSGDDAAFSISTDGATWTRIGAAFKLTFGNWRGDRPGLFCFNSLTDDAVAAGCADFDYFRCDEVRSLPTK